MFSGILGEQPNLSKKQVVLKKFLLRKTKSLWGLSSWIAGSYFQKLFKKAHAVSDTVRQSLSLTRSRENERGSMWDSISFLTTSAFSLLQPSPIPSYPWLHHRSPPLLLHQQLLLPSSGATAASFSRLSRPAPTWKRTKLSVPPASAPHHAPHTHVRAGAPANYPQRTASTTAQFRLDFSDVATAGSQW